MTNGLVQVFRMKFYLLSWRLDWRCSRLRSYYLHQNRASLTPKRVDNDYYLYYYSVVVVVDVGCGDDSDD